MHPPLAVTGPPAATDRRGGPVVSGPNVVQTAFPDGVSARAGTRPDCLSPQGGLDGGISAKADGGSVPLAKSATDLQLKAGQALALKYGRRGRVSRAAMIC